MKRCLMCGGRFGLVRHYQFDKQFCSRRCLDTHRHERMGLVARRRAAFARAEAIMDRAVQTTWRRFAHQQEIKT